MLPEWPVILRSYLQFSQCTEANFWQSQRNGSKCLINRYLAFVLAFVLSFSSAFFFFFNRLFFYASFHLHAVFSKSWYGPTLCPSNSRQKRFLLPRLISFSCHAAQEKLSLLSNPALAFDSCNLCSHLSL